MEAPPRPAGMNRLLFVTLLLLAAIPATGDDTLYDTQEARARIGSGRWTRIIRIENPDGHSDYPDQFHALVFELESLLWLYVPGVGTQSLSLFSGRTERDKLDLQPLLLAANPAFSRHSVVDAALVNPPDGRLAGATLPEGCFIHAVSDWDAMRDRGETPEFAGILVYHVSVDQRGHAVFYFTSHGHHFIIDRARSNERIPINVPAHPNPTALAAAAVDYRVRKPPKHARLLPLSHPPQRSLSDAPSSLTADSSD